MRPMKTHSLVEEFEDRALGEVVIHTVGIGMGEADSDGRERRR